MSNDREKSPIPNQPEDPPAMITTPRHRCPDTIGAGRRSPRPVAVLLVALLLLLAGSSCSGTRKAGAGAVRERSPEFLVRQMISNQVDARWLDARAKIDYKDGALSVGATAQIRLQRDSFLWVAVRKLGFEVARALIRPDSVFVIDRLNNEYMARELSHITKTYNLPADFGMLQAIVLGNPLFFTRQGLQAQIEDGQYHLYGNSGATESHYWLGGNDLRLTRMRFGDQDRLRNVDARFSNYGQSPADQKFSYLRSLELSSRETGNVSVGIEFSQVEFNVPKSVKFEIPERYTRID